MGGERFDTESFRSVMASIKNIDTELFGHGVGPMRSFAGDESVYTFGRSLFEFSTRASSNNPDLPADARTRGNHQWLGVRRPLKPRSEFGQRNANGSLQPKIQVVRKE